MIRYALKCAEGHRFESWFQSADAFDTVSARVMVACAICGSTDVKKDIMAPRVATGDEGSQEAPSLSQPAHPSEQALRALKTHLEKTSSYVGKDFPQQARAMHVGDADMRPIHGEASATEAKALLEEGVPIAPLPIIPTDKAN